MTKPRIHQQNAVAVVDEQARSASPYEEKSRPGFDEPRLIPQDTAASTTFDLGRAMVVHRETADMLGLVTPDVDHDHSFDVPFVDVPAADTVEIDPMAVLRATSWVARAGARHLVAQVAPTEVREGIQLMFREDQLLRSVEPAPFALVAEGIRRASYPYRRNASSHLHAFKCVAVSCLSFEITPSK